MKTKNDSKTENAPRKTGKKPEAGGQKPQPEQGLTAPIKLGVLLTVVERRRSEFYMDLIQSYGVNLQYVTKAKKLSDAGLASAFGLDDAELSAIISVVRLDIIEKVAGSLDKRFRSPRYGPGEAYVIPLSSVIGKNVFGFLAGDPSFSAPQAEKRQTEES